MVVCLLDFVLFDFLKIKKHNMTEKKSSNKNNKLFVRKKMNSEKGNIYKDRGVFCR